MTETAAKPRPQAPGMQALTGNPAFRKNPYPFYEMLRHQQPVFRSPAGFWLLTRYAECHAVLGDDRFGYPRTDAEAAKADETAAGFTSQRDFFFFKNPPDHTRIRAIVRDALSPKVVHGLRPYVQAAADRLLDAALPDGEFDLIASRSTCCGPGAARCRPSSRPRRRTSSPGCGGGPARAPDCPGCWTTHSPSWTAGWWPTWPPARTRS